MSNLIKLYNRTLENCQYYCANGKEWSLMNEIGCLRGIMYAMQELKVDFDYSEAARFIKLQQCMKSRDEV